MERLCQRCRGRGYYMTYYGADPEADPRMVTCKCTRAEHTLEELKHPESPQLHALPREVSSPRTSRRPEM